MHQKKKTEFQDSWHQGGWIRICTWRGALPLVPCSQVSFLKYYKMLVWLSLKYVGILQFNMQYAILMECSQIVSTRFSSCLMFTHQIMMRFTSERDGELWLGTILLQRKKIIDLELSNSYNHFRVLCTDPCRNSRNPRVDRFELFPRPYVLMTATADDSRHQLTLPGNAGIPRRKERAAYRWNPSMAMLLRAIVTYIVCCFAILQRHQCRSSVKEFSWVGFFKAYHYIHIPNPLNDRYALHRHC